MLVHLTEDKLWRGRLYPTGDREIPDDLAIALGFDPDPAPAVEPPAAAADDSEPTPTETEPWVNLLAALNQAQSAKDLEPLPTIGAGAAKRILSNRPTSGYHSLEQVIELNSELSRQPYRVDWDQVRGWADV